MSAKQTQKTAKTEPFLQIVHQFTGREYKLYKMIIASYNSDVTNTIDTCIKLFGANFASALKAAGILKIADPDQQETVSWWAD